jgi:hypothetical protein
MKKLILTLIFCLVGSIASAGMNGYLAAVAKKKTSGSCAGGSDGTIGTQFDSGTANGDLDLAYSEFTPTEDGTVTYMHAQVSFVNGATMRMGIWSSTGTLLVRSGTFVGDNSNPQVVHSALESSYCLVTGTTYIVGLCFDGTDNDVYVARGAYNAAFEVRGYTTMSTDLSNFATASSTQIYSGRKFAITANNSADTM